MYLGLGVVAENKVASGVKVAVVTDFTLRLCVLIKAKRPFICKLSSTVCFSSALGKQERRAMENVVGLVRARPVELDNATDDIF